MNKRYLFVVLIALLACSKAKNPTGYGITDINYLSANEMEFSNYFDIEKAEFVQFEMSDTVILGNELIIKRSNDSYFVFDKTTLLFYRFNNAGKFINKIGTPGKAQEEHYAVSDFQCDDKNEVVHLLCSSGNEIKRYTYGGAYIETIKLPVNVWSFALVDVKSYWLYTCFFSSDSYRLHYFDNGEIIKSVLPIKTNHFGMSDINFSGNNGFGLFKEPFFPTIYGYSKDSLYPLLTINFGQYTQTEDDFERIDDPFQFTDESYQKGFYAIFDAFQNINSFVFEVVFQNNTGAEITFVICNKETKSAIKLLSEIKSKDFVNKLKIVSIDDSDTYYFVTDPQELYSFTTMFGKNIISSDKFDRNGNPVVLKLLPR